MARIGHFLVLMCCIIAACVPSADERCGSNYYWDTEQRTCWPNPTDTETASETQPSSDHTDSETTSETAQSTDTNKQTSSDTDTTTGSDTGSTSESETPQGPSGQGDACAGPDDCQGKDASYCAMQPGTPSGYCTVNDCNASPDDCPAGYVCCVFAIPSILPFCATQADYEAMGEMCSAIQKP